MVKLYFKEEKEKFGGKVLKNDRKN